MMQGELTKKRIGFAWVLAERTPARFGFRGGIIQYPPEGTNPLTEKTHRGTLQYSKEDWSIGVGGNTKKI